MGTWPDSVREVAAQEDRPPRHHVVIYGNYVSPDRAI